MHEHEQSGSPATAVADDARDLYLELMKRCLTRLAFDEPYRPLRRPARRWQAKVLLVVQRALASRRLELVAKAPPAGAARETGRDWPVAAETMVGLARLENVERCVRDVLEQGVPGDLIETGVWRGGTTIFMRAILAAYGDTERVVWAADSFRGLPKPSGRYGADTGDPHWTYDDLAVSADDVRRNFERYDLLDEQVRFLEGWFQDTLPTAPIERLAVARLDGDMYESTIVALDALYPKLSVGGYVIVDDYGAIEGCRRAVDDYRGDHGIAEPIREVDWTGVYWQRES